MTDQGRTNLSSGSAARSQSLGAKDPRNRRNTEERIDGRRLLFPLYLDRGRIALTQIDGQPEVALLDEGAFAGTELDLAQAFNALAGAFNTLLRAAKHKGHMRK